jgi:oligopeptide/dipeptide ABC transporter ATP-binding protein
VLEGDLPSPADPPSGCLFRTRCQKFANELTEAEREPCLAQHPPLNAVGDDHRAACHYAERLDVI